MKETVEHVRKNNWIYRIACFLIGRKLTYEELFLILERINERSLGKKMSSKKSMDEVVKVYMDLHDGKKPKEIIEYENK